MIYKNKFINILSFIITIILFLILNSFISQNSVISIRNIPNIISKIEFPKALSKVKEQNNEKLDIEIGNWYIEIPSINLKAPIAEGTDIDTLNTKVGHFNETDKTVGNVGLAAHNRGYKYNYFEKLKKLKINDEIIYKYENFEKKYLITKIEIIKNTDWSYLEKTEKNKITLITCVENEPQYRRCVQAEETEN